MATLAYRLTVPGVGSAFAPGDPDPLPDTDFYITSKRRVNHPWIAQRDPEDPESGPDISGDGQRVDPLTGRVEDGQYQVRVIDVPEPIVTVVCDRDVPLLVEGNYGLDSTAYGAGDWTRKTDQANQTWPPFSWWQVAADPYLAGNVLFFWIDQGSPPYTLGTWVRETWIEKTFDGTEDGGAAWTPGQIVGFHFRSNWTLDTGPGNVFAEANGDRVSFPNGSYDFWTIDQSLASNISDNVMYTTADVNGEVLIKLGAENIAPSMNINVSFTALEFVTCEEAEVPSGGERYVTSWLADEDARQQLRNKKAYLEESLDSGVTWSRVLYSGYVESIVLEESLTYLFTLGDTRRVERLTPAWADINPAGALIHQKMTALIGGPVYGGWNPLVRNYGLPTFRVTDQQAATLGDNGWVELTYRSGPLPPTWKEPAGAPGPQRDTLRKLAQDVINARAEEFHDTIPKAAGLFHRGAYPGLRAALLNVNTETVTLADLTPLSLVVLPNWIPTGILSIFGLDRPVLMAPDRSLRLRWSVTSTATYPNGTDFKLLITPRDVSEKWPLHVAMHPVVLTSALYDLIGEPWDTTTATSVKALVGDHRVTVMRLTDPAQTVQQINEMLFGLYQYGTRRNDDGEWAFFYLGKIDTVPTPDLSLATLHEEGGPTFDHGTSPRTNSVVVRSQLFSEYREGDEGEPPFDTLVVRDAPATFTLSPDGETPDADLYGKEEQDYSLPGYDGFYSDLSPMGLAQRWAHLAESTFDRHGRGAVLNTVVCIRGTAADNATLGAAVKISPDHLPNARLGRVPTSQRIEDSGESRWARVIQRTEEPVGAIIQVIDDSTGVQYAETIDIAITPAANADPAYFYDVELDGITQCQTDAARIEVQFALGASVPTAGNPYTILNAALFVDNLDAVVDPWTETLGPFPRGQTVWFRVRAFRYSGRPGAWSAWCHIGGCATGPQTTLSDLVISAINDDGATLAWSYDEAPPVGSVKVQYRLSGGGGYTTFATLAAGTETDDLTGLNPDTSYDVRVVLIDGGSVEYGDVLLGTFVTVAGAISGLTLGTPTTDGVALSWANTDTTNRVRVEVKLDTESVYHHVIDLPAGSTAYVVTGLIPETDYDVRVVLVDSVTGAEVGSALLDSFTTDLAANQTALTTPTNAAVFEGWDPIAGIPSPGTYGLQVQAVFGPAQSIVFEEAVETAVGSGTPGTYAVAATLGAIVGDVTRHIAVAPNDEKLRYLRAYATASGYDDSAATTALEADPWPATPTVPTPTTPPSSVGGMLPYYIAPTESFTVPLYYQAPQGMDIDIEGTLTVDGFLIEVD